MLTHIIFLSFSKLQYYPLFQPLYLPMNSNTFYGVPNSAHVTKDSISTQIYGTPHALQRLKAGRGRGTGRYHYYSPSQKLQREFTRELKITIGKQTIPPVIMRQQCSISISFFFPRPMKHFDPSGHILPDCQSEIISCKKADVDNLVKFVLDSIQGLIIADDWRVAALHAEKRWSSKTELVDNNKWIGVGFTNLHVNFDGASLEPLILTGHNAQEVILL